MSEFYTEQLVSSKSSAKDVAIRSAMIVITVIALFLSMSIPYLMIVAIVLVVIDVYLIRNMSIEYEYLYINGDLDIDRIVAKQKRKQVFSVNMNDVILIAPKDSGEIRAYQNIKVSDYSSKSGVSKLYEMVILKDGQKKGVLFEPNHEILEGMKMIAPRKVII